MFKVLYRRVINDANVGPWILDYHIGKFSSIDSAKQAVLEAIYSNNPEATLDNFCDVSFGGEPIYELIEPFNPRDYQFKFIETESPWKLGLKDAIH